MEHALKELKQLVAEAVEQKVHKLSENSLQTSYVIETLKILGWNKSDWDINEGPAVKSGKIPDIVLHDKSKDNMLVVECKDANPRFLIQHRRG